MTVFRNNKPWVEIRPLASAENSPLPEDTLKAIKEADEMRDHPENYERYDSPEALFKALDI